MSGPRAIAIIGRGTPFDRALAVAGAESGFPPHHHREARQSLGFTRSSRLRLVKWFRNSDTEEHLKVALDFTRLAPRSVRS